MAARTVYYTKVGYADLERLHAFLSSKSRRTADRAINKIRRAVIRLGDFPEAGRPTPDLNPVHRELLVPFGHSGYVVLYGLDGPDVVIISVRHQREAGY